MAFNHYVVVDGDRYALPGDGGMDAVKRELLEAVRSGGAYVSLGREGIGYTEVLVTGATQIRIEHVVVVETPADEEDQNDPADPYWFL